MHDRHRQFLQLLGRSHLDPAARSPQMITDWCVWDQRGAESGSQESSRLAVVCIHTLQIKHNAREKGDLEAR
jgi:hypothetical protein